MKNVYWLYRYSGYIDTYLLCQQCCTKTVYCDSLRYCRTVTIILYIFQTTTNLNNACVRFRLQLFKQYIYELELL